MEGNKQLNKLEEKIWGKVGEVIERKRSGNNGIDMQILKHIKIGSVEYGDDIIVWALKEKKMKQFVKALRKYLNIKKLQLNPNQPNITTFKNEGLRKKRKIYKYDTQKSIK